MNRKKKEKQTCVFRAEGFEILPYNYRRNLLICRDKTNILSNEWNRQKGPIHTGKGGIEWVWKLLSKLSMRQLNGNWLKPWDIHLVAILERYKFPIFQCCPILTLKWRWSMSLQTLPRNFKTPVTQIYYVVTYYLSHDLNTPTCPRRERFVYFVDVGDEKEGLLPDTPPKKWLNIMKSYSQCLAIVEILPVFNLN